MNNRNILIAVGLAAVVILVAAIFLMTRGGTSAEDQARALREGLGIAQPEDFVYAYPVTANAVALDPRCDLACAQRELSDGRSLVQTGGSPQGFIVVDSPPPGCLFLSLRFNQTDWDRLTEEPLPIFIDAAPFSQMVECNPDVPLRSERGLVQVPPWYRSIHGMAVSVPAPVITQNSTFRIAVCARTKTGEILQFSGDETMRDLSSEAVSLCTNLAG